MKTKLVNALIVCFILTCTLTLVHAHGAKIRYKADMTYEITAKYDDGTAMSEAQVIIYAPDNPQIPWKKGKCNNEGKFSFTPDIKNKGTWTVQVRKSGHGGSINFCIDDSTFSADETGYSPVQTVIMTACVVWGFIGTALYFSRRKSNAHT